MQVLVVFIKKEGNTYIATSPNLIGISATAATYEEAQEAILDAMDKRVIEIIGMHNNRPPISRRPIEETIGCVYKDSPKSKHECSNSAKKDGLCLIHWRKLYGHPYGKTLKTCPLCGETDAEILGDYEAACSFKTENPDWETVFEELKIKNAIWKKERDEVKVKNLNGKLRCSKIMANKNRCTREAYRGEFCFSHR